MTVVRLEISCKVGSDGANRNILGSGQFQVFLLIGGRRGVSTRRPTAPAQPPGGGYAMRFKTERQ